MNIRAGSLFVAVLAWDDDGPEAPRLVTTERFQPNANLGEVGQWVDFRERIRQFLAPQGVDAIALMETRSYANWKYADALARVTKICAVLDVSHVLGVPFATHKTNAVAGTVKVEAKSLQTFPASAVGLSAAPTYWTTGLSEAAAVARHALGDKPASGTGAAGEDGS